MKVILQSDVKNLGLAGDVLSVKTGYARNYLFPKKSAIPFTKARGKQFLHQKQLIEAKKRKAVLERKDMVERLKNGRFYVEKEADEKGHLFGSVNVHQISQAMSLRGFEIDKKRIKLKTNLKEVGEHKVALDFGQNLQTEVIIVVKKVTGKGLQVARKLEKSVVKDVKNQVGEREQKERTRKKEEDTVKKSTIKMKSDS